MGCDVLGTDLSNPTARAEMNAADLVQIKDDVTGATDQTTVGEFLSDGKFDKYGSPEDRLKILQGGTWKNAEGTPYKSSLPIASGFESYRDQLRGAYQVRVYEAAAKDKLQEAKNSDPRFLGLFLVEMGRYLVKAGHDLKEADAQVRNAALKIAGETRDPKRAAEASCFANRISADPNFLRWYYYRLNY